MILCLGIGPSPLTLCVAVTSDSLLLVVTALPDFLWSQGQPVVNHHHQ